MYTLTPIVFCSRRGKCRRKKSKRRRNRDVSSKCKPNAQIYNAEKIMNVLTDHKEQDSIVLPNGEHVVSYFCQVL